MKKKKDLFFFSSFVQVSRFLMEPGEDSIKINLFQSCFSFASPVQPSLRLSSLSVWAYGVSWCTKKKK